VVIFRGAGWRIKVADRYARIRSRREFIGWVESGDVPPVLPNFLVTLLSFNSLTSSYPHDRLFGAFKLAGTSTVDFISSNLYGKLFAGSFRLTHAFVNCSSSVQVLIHLKVN
jgi:hypothetical protein